MFSSVLPSVPTNMIFMHNPSSKSNRYAPNVTYLANPNLYEGYLPIQPTEGPPATWYPNSSYNPPYGSDYAIYSTAASNTLNYDQSAQFLDFEDSSSIATDSPVSPAISTTSLETLKSPVDSESLIDESGIPEAENRVVQTSFPFPIPSGGRTSSSRPPSGDYMISHQHFSANINARSTTPFQPIIHHTPRALHPSYVVEDRQSTISDSEVDERDRIAKMNAEYNAISNAGSLTNSPSQPPKYSPDRFRDSKPTFQLPSIQTRPSLRLSASQPRHPDLHFPQRQIGNEKKELTSSPYRIYASPLLSIPQDLSPPSVERLPSQLPLEQNLDTNRTPPQSQSSPPVSRNHQGTSDVDRSRIVENVISSPIHSAPQTGHSSNASMNPQSQNYLSRVERSQTFEPSSVVPAEVPRKSRSNGQSPPSLGSDVQEGLQYKQSRPDAASSTTKNHFPPSPDLRQNTGVPKSPPHVQLNKSSESESTERTSLGDSLRRDTKTPGLSGRGPSFIQPSLDSPSASYQDVHSSPDMRAHKSSPKSFLDGKSGHLDNSRSPAEASPSSNGSSSSSSSSVSQSNRPLPHEDVGLRRPTKDANHDREFERHRRLRSAGSERTAVARFSDETSRGTAPMLSQAPLRSSPEGSLTAFLQPDSQVASVVTASEHRPTDLRPSKTINDQANIPNSFDSRGSRKVHEGQYVHFGKPQQEATKREGEDMRLLSSTLLSPPLNNVATTSSSLPSKVTLDFSQVMVPPEPHRRHSDGDQAAPPIRPSLHSRNSAPLVRSVRWTENLIAPSPIFAPPRRKGWFNRRGEQLWTNNGDYRPPRAGDEYPLDLNDYPEPGDGWMNEDGIRIDISHCRIPKALPRPALKKL